MYKKVAAIIVEKVWLNGPGLTSSSLFTLCSTSFRSSIAALICEKEENQQTKITFTESHLSMGTIGHKVNSTSGKAVCTAKSQNKTGFNVF